MPLQSVLPAWVVLNASNDPSASGMADVRTGFPYNSGGLNLGDYFDLTNAEAYRNCRPATATLYSGRYRRVQVDSGATAANVKTGTIGVMPSLAAASIDVGRSGGLLAPSMNVVTSFDQGIGQPATLPVRPVIFLNVVTPGNFCWVQEAGVASVLGKTGGLTKATPAVGDIINAATNGLVDDPTSQSSVGLTLGWSLDLPVSNALFRILLDLVIVQD